ncbi:hypothetical protein [Maridesulfovibrio ferrireducens]|uniref:hypothetical protein n=1 Tax=Maridesulfovibrio ferrireducens TaxID=246191 RepID=UPI001A2EDF9B|nr:hypothetical protein [Maridesulfovibrio ferrireducens]MBI9112886.1 hypothetical protein [Maridesulfovibrio ferrireducens]
MTRKLCYVLVLLCILLPSSQVQAKDLYLMVPAIGKVKNKEKDRHKDELNKILSNKDFKKELRKGILGFLKRATIKNDGINIKRAGFDTKFDAGAILIPLLFVDNVISFVDEFGSAEQNLYKGTVYIGINFLIFQAESESLVYSVPLIVSVPYLNKTKSFSLKPLAGQIRSAIVTFFTDRKTLKPNAQESLANCLADIEYLFATKTCSVSGINISQGTLKRIKDSKKYSALAEMLTAQALSEKHLVLPAKSRFPAIRRGLHAAVSMFGVSFQQGSEKGFSERDNVYQTKMRMPEPEIKYTLTIKTGVKDVDLGPYTERNYTTACYLEGGGDKIKCIKGIQIPVSKRHTKVSDVHFYNSLINALSDIDSCTR